MIALIVFIVVIEVIRAIFSSQDGASGGDPESLNTSKEVCPCGSGRRSANCCLLKEVSAVGQKPLALPHKEASRSMKPSDLLSIMGPCRCGAGLSYQRCHAARRLALAHMPHANEAHIKTISDNLARDAIALLEYNTQGLGNSASTPSSLEMACLKKCIKCICKADFRRWRASARNRSCPTRYMPSGVEEDICDIVERDLGLSSSMIDASNAHAIADSLVQQTYAGLALGFTRQTDEDCSSGEYQESCDYEDVEECHFDDDGNDVTDNPDWDRKNHRYRY